jgi:N-acetylneuraminate synthase
MADHSTVNLGGRPVGPGRPCFVLAEAGVNHNGDVRLALRLVEAAKQAGADAVKFQTWVTDKLVTPDARMADYQARNLGRARSQYEMLKELELSYDDFRAVKDHADRLGILFLSTPDEEDSADFLGALGVPAFKVGSGEVTNLPFLCHVARKGKPVILSTGMSTLGEVEAAVRAVEEAGNRQLVLLHCVSAYPADPADCNLRAMDTLAAAFGYPVGFSDHTPGTEIAQAAAARGACVLEKHLTLDKALPGPDHQASLDPAEFAALVRGVRTVETALGDGRKQPTPGELETKQRVQKSLVTTRALRPGDRLTPADVTLRRSDGGLPAAYLPLVLGRTVAREVPAGRALCPDDLR